MGDTQEHGNDNEVAELINKKSVYYGDTWKIAGEVWNLFAMNRSSLAKSPYVGIWFIIMQKMFRILVTPYNRDHWLDIQAYCRLVLGDIDDSLSGE